MDTEIRAIAPEEFEAYARALELAFSERMTDEELERERLVAEPSRWHAAFEGGRIVGGAAAASYQVTVPGGREVSAAGVTAVGVLPTHRRRGINTALMRTQLDDVHALGEAIAMLFASEGGIYGRFGYGMASLLCEVDVEVDRSRFVRGYRPGGEVRLLSREDALPAMRPVYDAVRRERPGMVAVDDRWWEWLFFEKKDEGPIFYAVHEGDEGIDAFAVYRVKHEWPDSIAKLEVSVHRLMASTPQGWADMWRYVFDIDLVHKVGAWNRPVDDPVLRLMQEPRRLHFSVKDGLYVRLVDVPAALAARGYVGDGRTIFEVHDAFCPWNDGRFSLEVTRGEAICQPTTAEADIACSATDLGASYLGGASFRELHRAGHVDELRPGALAAADAIFASDPAPWCAFVF